MILLVFLPMLLSAQADAVFFDIKTLGSSNGQYSIYTYIDSMYEAGTPCDSIWQKESFRIQVDPSGSTLAVQALFHPESCKSRKYIDLLYHIRWKNLSFRKGRTLYLNFEEKKATNK